MVSVFENYLEYESNILTGHFLWNMDLSTKSVISVNTKPIEKEYKNQAKQIIYFNFAVFVHRIFKFSNCFTWLQL